MRPILIVIARRSKFLARVQVTQRKMREPRGSLELAHPQNSTRVSVQQRHRRDENAVAPSRCLSTRRDVEHRRVVSWLGTSSPFHITTEATTLGPFSEAEVKELYDQHTAATGQRFDPEAVARAFELGAGHPWLTNAIADQVVRRVPAGTSCEAARRCTACTALSVRAPGAHGRGDNLWSAQPHGLGPLPLVDMDLANPPSTPPKGAISTCS